MVQGQLPILKLMFVRLALKGVLHVLISTPALPAIILSVIFWVKQFVSFARSDLVRFVDLLQRVQLVSLATLIMGILALVILTNTTILSTKLAINVHLSVKHAEVPLVMSA